MARHLLKVETASGQDAVLRVADKLRVHLGSLVGVVGFRTLLHRALALSRGDFASLGNLTVSENGALGGFEGFSAQLTDKQIEDSSEALIGHLIALLETFIGDALTRRLLDDVWPDAGSKTAAQKAKKL